MRLGAIAAISIVLAAEAVAQVPARDARDTNLPSGRMHFEMPVYKTLPEWEARAAQLRKQILASAGLLPMPERTPLHPQIFGRIEREGYSVEKVLLETMPGFYLGGNLYRPVGKSGKFPGVASPHGHWDFGRLENTATVSVPGRCINLARQGYVVFTYDMLGYDDTIQTPHDFGGPREDLWSFNALGLQLWNSMRAIDFLQSLPDVDRERIAVTGASGGGTQTFLVSAVDQRVKVAAPVNMISAIMQGGPCESSPGLRFRTFNVEIGALMAPRPLLMVSATGDWTRNTPHDEFPAIQAIYKLYGKPELVESVQVDAPHNYNQQSREAVYSFFARQVLGETDLSRFKENKFRVEKPQDLLALHNRKLPDNALTYDGLLEQWITAAKRQNEASDPESFRERLKLALAAEWPSQVLSQVDGERVMLGRAGKGDRVPGIRISGAGSAALVVHPDGAEAARSMPEAREWIRAGRPLLAIDAYQTGRAVEPRDEPGRQHLIFNKSDAANRVQDILTGLKFLSGDGSAPVTLIGFGDAGVWCVFAAAVAQSPVKVKVDLGKFRGDDNDFVERFFVPSIQRAGGLRAALLLAKPELLHQHTP
jgi:Acetyl xylan esterase (AXE1)